MNINRYNYEEFFLLYVDNELTKADREEVEAFVHDNPDLEEELVMLKQSKLRPDGNIQFFDKSSLLKPESASIVNETNYEEFFLLYVDGELSAVERREVEEFAATNPALQQELNLLMQTKLEPEHEVVFADKSVLYKQPEKERPVVFMWRVIAVAAMLLVALGIFWISNRTVKPDTLAGTKPKNEAPKQNVPAPVAPVIKEEQQQLAVEQKTEKPVNTIKRDEAPENKKELAVNQKIEQPDNSTYTEPIIDRALDATEIAAAQKNSSASNGTGLNVNAGSASNPLAQTAVVQTAYTPVQEQDNKEYIANFSVDKKNKLRGLFRKVTRVFEKTTNLPAVEEKGILIGNLEIALK